MPPLLLPMLLQLSVVTTMSTIFTVKNSNSNDDDVDVDAERGCGGDDDDMEDCW